MPIDINIEENEEIFESLKLKLTKKYPAIFQYVAHVIISSVLLYVNNNGFIHTGTLDEENDDKKKILDLLKDLVKTNEKMLIREPAVYYREIYKPIEEIFKRRGSPDELKPYIHRSENCLSLTEFMATDLEKYKNITEDIAQIFTREIQMIQCIDMPEESIPEERKKIFLAALKYATIMVIEKQNELVKDLITKIEKKMAAQHDIGPAVGTMVGFKLFKKTSENTERKDGHGPSDLSAKKPNNDNSDSEKLSL